MSSSEATSTCASSVTEFELTTAAKQALTVNATLPPAEPVRETVDPVWVLHQLEGLSFPEQGSAYDHMKRCIDSAQAARDSERK